MLRRRLNIKHNRLLLATSLDRNTVLNHGELVVPPFYEMESGVVPMLAEPF
jgi:hypothetical protein